MVQQQAQGPMSPFERVNAKSPRVSTSMARDLSPYQPAAL
jgi:hypothetical protein